MTRHPEELPIVGWREWIALPSLKVRAIKAKIDTGANTSALHAFDIERFRRGNSDYVRFLIHPRQKNVIRTIKAEAPLLDFRTVRSSNGLLSQRPVIQSEVAIFDEVWTMELTLANRDQMGFRLLLGREALKGRFLVDCGSSFRDSSRIPVKKKRT
jgi:hypothetical protein